MRLTKSDLLLGHGEKGRKLGQRTPISRAFLRQLTDYVQTWHLAAAEGQCRSDNDTLKGRRGFGKPSVIILLEGDYQSAGPGYWCLRGRGIHTAGYRSLVCFIDW